MLAGEHALQVSRPFVGDRDEGQVDGRLVDGRELGLGALGRFLEPLQRHAIGAQVDAGLLLEVADQPVHDAAIEVLAAEVDVAVGGAHLEDAVRQLHDRDVEGAAAEVVDRDVERAAPLVETVGERRGGGLVDDALHLEAADPAGVAGRLALGVVEVGGHRHDRFLGFLAERLLGLDAQLAQQDARDLLGDSTCSRTLTWASPFLASTTL